MRSTEEIAALILEIRTKECAFCPRMRVKEADADSQLRCMTHCDTLASIDALDMEYHTAARIERAQRIEDERGLLLNIAEATRDYRVAQRRGNVSEDAQEDMKILGRVVDSLILQACREDII